MHDHLWAGGLSSRDLFLIKERSGKLQLSLNPSMKPRWRSYVQASLPDIRADVTRRLEGWPVEVKF